MSIVFLYDLFDAKTNEFQKLIKNSKPNWILIDDTNSSLASCSKENNKIIFFNELHESYSVLNPVPSYKLNPKAIFLRRIPVARQVIQKACVYQKICYMTKRKI